jgi:glutathione S-transferase
MKLYFASGACSMGTHLLLEETGAPFEAHKVSFADQEQYKPDFVAINPKSKVPTLVRDDGSVLTEFPAIAYWIARRFPDAKLMPEDVEGQARALEATDYAVATIHMQGFTRMFRPGNFTPNAADEDRVRARGREIAEKAFGIMDKRLEGREYLVGQFSIADAALFYVEYWASGRANVPLPANCAAHFARMKARPSVQRMMKTEGLS